MSDICDWCANARELWNEDGRLEECPVCRPSPAKSPESVERALKAALAALGIV